MIVVADASVLVAELLRKRGRELLAHPELRVVVSLPIQPSVRDLAIKLCNSLGRNSLVGE